MLIAAALGAVNVFPQVSNIEGIEPLEGVVISKSQKTQSQTMNSVDSIRIGFINTEQLFKLTGKVNNKDNLEFLNLKLKNFAEKFKIKLILQEAVYITPKADITSFVASYIKGNSFSNDFIFNLPIANANFMRFINTDKIFKESQTSKNSSKLLENEFKSYEIELESIPDKKSAKFAARKKEFQDDLNRRKNEELTKVLAIANEKINDFTLKMGYDLILQKAVYVAPELDISNEIMLMMR